MSQCHACKRLLPPSPGENPLRVCPSCFEKQAKKREQDARHIAAFERFAERVKRHERGQG